MNNNRLERVASNLQRELSQIILYELNNPDLGFITITRVEPAPDLLQAKVYLTVLGDENKIKDTLTSLKEAANYIQHTLMKRVRMRYIPRLSFHYDDCVIKELQMNKLFNEISKTDKKKS